MLNCSNSFCNHILLQRDIAQKKTSQQWPPSNNGSIAGDTLAVGWTSNWRSVSACFNALVPWMTRMPCSKFGCGNRDHQLNGYFCGMKGLGLTWNDSDDVKWVVIFATPGNHQNLRGVAWVDRFWLYHADYFCVGDGFTDKPQSLTPMKNVPKNSKNGFPEDLTTQWHELEVALSCQVAGTLIILLQHFVKPPNSEVAEHEIMVQYFSTKSEVQGSHGTPGWRWKHVAKIVFFLRQAMFQNCLRTFKRLTRSAFARSVARGESSLYQGWSIEIVIFIVVPDVPVKCNEQFQMFQLWRPCVHGGVNHSQQTSWGRSDRSTRH